MRWVARDQTQQHLAEAKTREREEQLRSIIGTASEAVIVADHKGLITLWNKASETIFGHTAEEAIGQPIRIIVPERLREGDGVAGVPRGVVAILAAHRADLPPETLAALDENLRSIDRAIAEIHLALEANPEHHALNFLLAEAYRREADLLVSLEWWMRAPDEVRS